MSISLGPWATKLLDTDGLSAETEPKVAAIATIAARASPPSNLAVFLITRAPELPIFICMLVFAFFISIASSITDFVPWVAVPLMLFAWLLSENFMSSTSSIRCSPIIISARRHAIVKIADFLKRGENKKGEGLRSPT